MLKNCILLLALLNASFGLVICTLTPGRKGEERVVVENGDGCGEDYVLGWGFKI